MSYNANGLLNSDGSVTQFGNTRSSGGGGGVGTVVNLTTTNSDLFNQTVTLTGTYDTYTATFDSTGHATVNVFYVDTYAVTCQGSTDSVTVSAIGLVINADVFSVTTVNITTSDSDLIGETISVYFGSDPTDVRASLTFDSNLSVSFQTEDIGTYNIVIGYSNPVSFTVSSVGDIVNVTYNPTPTGSSVTPVNNVRNWLDSAKVFDKNYTTISQVLSDTTTLQTLISSNNANDYLVRSTSWVSNVCGNSTAMSYIGLNNYSANTLLADSTWRTAICNSTYFESVLNVKVPTMTSDTTPSGMVVYSSQFDNNFNAARTVFDGNDTGNAWNCAQSEYGKTNQAYVGYMFPSSKKILFAKVIPVYGSSNYKNYNYRLIGSDNGSSWVEISSANTAATYDSWNPILYVTTPTTRQYYGVRGSFQSGTSTYAQLISVQFYGREDV